MKLASLLTPKQVILDLKGEVCSEAIGNIVEHLITQKLLKNNLREEILESLKER